VVNLTTELKGNVVILGIGNTLKSDDGAGIEVVRKLEILNTKLEINSNYQITKCLDGGSAPENLTGEIKRLKPDTLVIVDAVDFKGQPGEVRVIPEERVSDTGFTTHNMSMRTYINFLREDLPLLKVVIVGIQPKTVAFGEGLSPEVQKGVEEICTSFI
jgi:hydrogenase 3 maturation protease